MGASTDAEAPPRFPSQLIGKLGSNIQMKISHMRRFTLPLSIATLACALSVSAADNPFLGTWKVDLTRSKSSTVPANLTVVIEPDGQDGVKISEDYVGSMDVPRHVTGTNKFDGKDYPLTGSPRPAATRAIRRVDSHGWEVTVKSEGKVVQQYRAVVSSDGNTLTHTGTNTSRPGEPREFHTVYVRR
jgi:hypothetical protein